MRRYAFCLLLATALPTWGAGPQKLEISQPKGKLVAALDLPEGKGPFPVLLIQPGSGPTDRDGNASLGLKSDCYKMLGAALAKRGIAVVRIDKRGIGESAKALVDESNISISDYVNDIAAWVKLLRNDGRFSKVYFAGHSEGSMLGAVAVRTEPVDGFIALCGPGKDFGQILRDQLKPKLSDDLYKKALVPLESLEAGKEADCPEELKLLFRKSVQPYLISLLKIRPDEDFAKLTCPCLILSGAKDIQISPEHAQRLAKANPKAKLVTVEKMSHVLKVVTDDEQYMKPYTDPSVPLADGLVDAIADFIKK